MDNSHLSLPSITEEERFYGCITGLLIEPSLKTEDGEEPQNFYATFEYNGQSTAWLVPDLELFQALSPHLIRTAVMRREHRNYGYDKLWIAKKEGCWQVWLP